MRQALHHLRARRAAHAAAGEEGRQPHRLRPRQAGRQHDARAAQAPGGDRGDRCRGRPHRGKTAFAGRARDPHQSRRRPRHARAGEARQNRLHPLRLGVPQLRVARRFPRSGAGSEDQETQEVTPFTAFDHAMMARALELGAKGLYTTTPNPRVGCVIAQGETVIGEGWHEKAGGPHAEVVAIGQAGARVVGATLYVNLEPCNHQGRTAPCVDLIKKNKIKRVIAAMVDPNPKAAGGGAALAAAGIGFQHGLMEAEAKELNIGFVSRVTRGRPWVRMKIAATLDGRTALANGKSQWITGAAARKDGHHWRARACAILTGIGTVKADDPRLTVRDVETPRQPLRVVVDSRLEIAENARIFEGGNVLIFCGVEPKRKLSAEIQRLPNATGKV